MTRRHCSNVSAISVVQIIFIVGLTADRVKAYSDLRKKAESGLPSFKETDSDLFNGASEQFRAVIRK